MSMINDALKRAQKQSPSTASGPQLRPAEPSQLANRTLILMVPLLLVFAVLIGVFFLWQAFQSPRRPEPVRAKTVPVENSQPVIAQQQQPAPKPVQQPVQTAPPAPKVVQPPVQSVQAAPKAVRQPVKPVQLAMAPVPKPKVETPKPVSAPAPEKTVASASAQPAPAAVAPPPAPPTPVKLQAIFYSPGHSTAMLNGKTVAVGDALKEWRIVAITPTTVKIISFTRTNVLTLPVQ